MEYSIVRWQGIKNEKGIVTQGYLYVKFNQDTKIININPNVVKAKVKEYFKNQNIGFGIIAGSKKDAIENFKRDFQIIHKPIK